jgi:hypothetical protein
MFLTSACLEILLNASKLVVLIKWISLRHYCAAEQMQAAKIISPRDDRLFNGNEIEPLSKLHWEMIGFPNVRLNNRSQKLAQFAAQVSDGIKLAQKQADFDLASRVPWMVEGTGLRQILV